MRFDGVLAAGRSAGSRPGLLLWCAIVALLDGATVLGWLVLIPGGAFWPGMGLLVVQQLVATVLVAATLPGCYAIYRTDTGLRDAIGTAVAATRQQGRRLLASGLVTFAVWLPVTVALAAAIGTLFLGVDTLAVWAATVGFALDRELLAVVAILGSLFGGAWLAAGALAFQDLLVLDGVARPRSAWWASAAAATANPAWFVAQALLRGLLLAAPWLVAAAALVGIDAVLALPTNSTNPLPLVGAVVAFVAVAPLARAVLVAYHVDTYERVIRSTVDRGDRSLVEHPRRLAVVALVLLAAVGGVAMVRTADVAPEPDLPSADIEPANADATVQTAVERTVASDVAFESDQDVYNATTDRWLTVIEVDARIDQNGREVYLDARLHIDADETDRVSYYATDGLFAITSRSGQVRLYNPLEVRMRRGNWTMAVGRPFGSTVADFDILPRESEGWTRVERGDGTVTYRTTDLYALADSNVGASIPPRDSADSELLSGSEARVIIDRETATVERFSVTVVRRDSYGDDEGEVRRSRSVVVINEVGDVAVERPDALGGPGPLERLWDVVYYG